MQASVSARARSSPKRVDQRDGVDALLGAVVAVTGDRQHRHVELGRHLGDAADRLAVERLGIEEALARHHQVGVLELVEQLDLVGHHVEPALEASAGCRQPPGQPAGRARSLESAHVDRRGR